MQGSAPSLNPLPDVRDEGVADYTRGRVCSPKFLPLERLRATNAGFADAFLAAGGTEENVAITSFDRDLDKFQDVQRFEPAV